MAIYGHIRRPLLAVERVVRAEGLHANYALLTIDGDHPSDFA